MRIDKIREGLKEEGIGGIVVSNIKNVRYISGFTGEEEWLLLQKTMHI